MSDLQELLAKLPTYSRPGTGEAWSETMQRIVTLLAEEKLPRPPLVIRNNEEWRKYAWMCGMPSEPPFDLDNPPPVQTIPVEPVDSLLPEGAEEFVSEGMPALRVPHDGGAGYMEVRISRDGEWDGRWPEKFGEVARWDESPPYGPEDFDSPGDFAKAVPWLRAKWKELESKPEVKPDPESTEDWYGDALEMLEELIPYQNLNDQRAIRAAVEVLRAERARRDEERNRLRKIVEESEATAADALAKRDELQAKVDELTALTDTHKGKSAAYWCGRAEALETSLKIPEPREPEEQEGEG